MDYIWVAKDVVLAIHDAQIAEHGGAPGLRDHGLLDSALARPRNLAAYEPAHVFRLAAAYAYGLSRNHPFVDGNKRTSFVITLLFLAINGRSLTAKDTDKVTTWISLSAGEIEEGSLADWIKQRSSNLVVDVQT